MRNICDKHAHCCGNNVIFKIVSTGAAFKENSRFFRSQCMMFWATRSRTSWGGVRFAVACCAVLGYEQGEMIAGLVLFAAAVVYRLLPVLLGMKLQQPEWLPNFSPMAALCLCGAAFLPKRLAIVVPLVALLGTDLALNAHYGFPLFTLEFLGKTIAFAAVAAFGWMLRKNARPAVILPAVLGGSLFFYIATNTASWLYEPGYAKSAAGWLQALTTGLPGYAPTWIFYRNTLAGDMLFAALFVACMHWSRRPTQDAITQAAAVR